MLEKKHLERISNPQIWYIEELNENTLRVRPYLHAPEIDETDVIPYENILGVYNDTWELEIGELIEYKV
jgi:hypothetical protein